MTWAIRSPARVLRPALPSPCGQKSGSVQDGRWPLDELSQTRPGKSGLHGRRVSHWTALLSSTDGSKKAATAGPPSSKSLSFPVFIAPSKCWIRRGIRCRAPWCGQGAGPKASQTETVVFTWLRTHARPPDCGSSCPTAGKRKAPFGSTGRPNRYRSDWTRWNSSAEGWLKKDRDDLWAAHWCGGAGIGEFSFGRMEKAGSEPSGPASVTFGCWPPLTASWRVPTPLSIHRMRRHALSWTTPFQSLVGLSTIKGHPFQEPVSSIAMKPNSIIPGPPRRGSSSQSSHFRTGGFSSISWLRAGAMRSGS